jgi:hypothetical protein
MDADINIGLTNEMKSLLDLTSRVEALEGKKSHDDFNRERATVNKVAIEQIGIIIGWETIQLENI